jgi:hypothetical protein
MSVPQQIKETLERPVLIYIAPLALMGMIAYMLPLLVFIKSLFADEILLSLVNRDFANYWVAGHFVVAGESLDLFTQQTYFARLQEIFGPGYPIHNWGYPPHFLLLLWPLAYVSYKAGIVLFLLATFVLFAISAVVFRHEYAPRSNALALLLAMVSYSMMMIDTSQNGFLTAALLLFGLATMQRRPMLAGLAFGLLTIKPQLGLLIPVLLLFDRNWRTIYWSILFTALLVAASAVFFGVESWHAYLTETLAYQQFVMTDWYGIFLRMMPTTFASIRTLGFEATAAFLVQWPVTLAATAMVVWLLWKEQEPLRRAFIMLCGTFLVSPYGFNYDMGALAVCAAVLLGTHSLRGRYGPLTVGLIAALPAAVMNLGRANLPVAPLILAAALFALAVSITHATDD